MTKRLVKLRGTDKFRRVENRKGAGNGNTGVDWSSCRKNSGGGGGGGGGKGGGKSGSVFINGVQYAFVIVHSEIKHMSSFQEYAQYFEYGMAAGGSVVALLAGLGVSVAAPALVVGVGLTAIINVIWTAFTTTDSVRTVIFSRPCHVL